jgi:hypothetical protein
VRKIASSVAINLGKNELGISEELGFGQLPMQDEREAIEKGLVLSLVVGSGRRHQVAKAGEADFGTVFVKVRSEKNSTGAGPIRTVFLTVFRCSAVSFDNIKFRLRRDRRWCWRRQRERMSSGRGRRRHLCTFTACNGVLGARAVRRPSAGAIQACFRVGRPTRDGLASVRSTGAGVTNAAETGILHRNVSGRRRLGQCEARARR